MTRFSKARSVWIAGLVAMSALVLAEIVWSIQRRTRGRERERQAGVVRAELKHLQATNPVLSEQKSKDLEIELQKTIARHARLRGELEPRGPVDTRMRDAVPNRRADAFFDLAAFAEKMRGQGAAAGVAMKPDEYFGFSAHRNEAPSLDAVAFVFRQRLHAEQLLQDLFAAQPRQFIGIQRERPAVPRTSASSSARANGVGGGGLPILAADYFVAPWSDDRKAVVANAFAYRIEFVGTTATLRNYLNTVVCGSGLVLVRSVEVQPVSDGELARDASPETRAARMVSVTTREKDAESVPVIARLFSKFTVVVQCAELQPGEAAIAAMAGSGRPAESSDDAARIVRWPEPMPQPGGDAWLYDVFTPPEIFYRPATGEFTVTPLSASVQQRVENPGEKETEAPLRVPFRLQLVGYMGNEGNYVGTFENVLTTEHFLARGGYRVPSLGLTIVDFQVRLMDADQPDAAGVRVPVATAVVRDEQAGRDVILTDRERVFVVADTGSLRAPGAARTNANPP
jgi:hypothetical protein